MKKTVSFKGAIAYVSILIGINIVVMLINDHLKSDLFLFIGNILPISFILPWILLYIEKKEKFRLGRYLYFVLMTLISSGILAYLFVLRF